MSGVDARWLHDLRNALNAVSVGLALTRRMLADGDRDAAAAMVAEAEAECERARRLLQQPPRD